MGLRRIIKRVLNSISTKIILPYLVLTLAVAGVGAFIVTNLVTSSLQERFNNQLLDSGRVVSETMVNYEQQRLEVLRLVARTEGVAESLVDGDQERLAALVPQIIANSSTDAVSLLDNQGLEIYGWQRAPGRIEGESRSGTDFSELEEVQLVLQGFVDEFGNKRVLLVELPTGYMLYTVGPVYEGDSQVGAVMIGTHVRNMLVGLTENAVARVTLYDRQGDVIGTTLGDSGQSVVGLLQGTPEQYEEVIRLLRESPRKYEVITADADNQVLLQQVEVFNQSYLLAYGDWRLRERSFGLFSVALPSNFIVSTTATSRSLLSLVFSLATVAVFTIGFFLARRIIHPLNRLVQISTAVAQGNLEQQTGIQRNDEIGTLARSFDTMTQRLAERNRQLVEQASKLEAILNSIADGVIVFDTDDQIIASNPAAERVLVDSLHESVFTSSENSLLTNNTNGSNDHKRLKLDLDQLLNSDFSQGSQRYEIGSRVFSALAAPVKTPEGDKLGRVVVFRDTTREAEAEQLKDGFITSVSHELRTPLTSIKGYIDLLLMTGTNNMDDNQLKFAKIANNNTVQLINHVDKLIDIAELQSGALKLEREPVHFSKLAAETTVAWKEQMEEKGLSVQFQMKDRKLWVDGDAERLVWALNNLLRNAHDYTPAGGNVRIEIFREHNKARVDITDTGIGISATDQPYLFTRFFRAQNEHMFNVPGMGLGLFIVRSIVEAHGGAVWARSEVGVGSMFSLALPLIGEREEVTGRQTVNSMS